MKRKLICLLIVAVLSLGLVGCTVFPDPYGLGKAPVTEEETEMSEEAPAGGH